MSYWPQVLMAIFILTPAVMGIVNHGKTIDKPINGWNNAAITLWLVLLLGMAGFWKF
jgi:hypothetical protein